MTDTGRFIDQTKSMADTGATIGRTGNRTKELSNPNFAIISSKKLLSMRKALKAEREEQDRVEGLNKERVHLHEKSQARVKNWTNTIEAIRIKKAARLAEKRKAEEEARIALDKEEEAIAAGKRKAAIARAKKLIAEEKDSVKEFHSTLLLSEVMKEREMQMSIKKQQKEMAKRKEEAWHQQLITETKRQEEEEARKLSAMKEKEAELAKMHMEQAKEAARLREAERKAEIEEGKRMKAQAEEHARAERAAEEARKQATKERNFVTRSENEQLLGLRAEKKKVEAAELERINRWAKQKEAVEAERARVAEEKFKAKLATRQKLIDEQYQNLVDMRDAEQARLEAEIAKQDAKAKAENERRLKYQETTQKEVEKSRDMQIQSKLEQKQAKWKEEVEFRKAYQKKIEAMKAEEVAEKQRLKEQAQAIVAENMRLVEERKRLAAKEKEQAIAEAELAKMEEAAELEDYKQTTSAYMDRWGQEGKPVKPLELLVNRQTNPAKKKRDLPPHARGHPNLLALINEAYDE